MAIYCYQRAERKRILSFSHSVIAQLLKVKMELAERLLYMNDSRTMEADYEFGELCHIEPSLTELLDGQCYISVFKNHVLLVIV